MCRNCMDPPVLFLCRITNQVGLSTNASALCLGVPGWDLSWHIASQTEDFCSCPQFFQVHARTGT
jgi:hypothetical protein